MFKPTLNNGPIGKPGYKLLGANIQGARSGLEFPTADLEQYFNNYFAEHDESPLTIPTPLLDNQLTHPDVVYFENGWNGYKYWMAFTPLPEINPDENENPCVVASNDKITWVVPDGASNPITPQPPISYNADTTLFYEGGYLYVFYRSWVQDPDNRSIIAYKKSSDGVNWSTQGEITFTGITDIQYQLISPSIIKFNGKYYIFAVERYSPTVIEDVKTIRVESSTLEGTYSNPTYITMDESKSIVGDRLTTEQYPWHANFKTIGNKILGIIYYRVSSLIQYQLETLFFTISDDAINFKLSQQAILTRQYEDQGFWDTSQYRSAFLPRIVNKKYVFDLWYPGWYNDHEIFPTRIGYTELSQVDCGLDLKDTNTINQTRLDELVNAVALTNGYTFGDDCNRADGSINPATCGLNYTITHGAFEIANNYIKNSNEAVNSYFTLDVPLNYEMKFQAIKGVGIPGAGSDGGLFFWAKAKATSKWISIQDSPHYTEIVKVQDISSHQINKFYAPYRRTLLNEYKIIFNGYNMKYYCNGKLLIDHTFTAADADSQAGLDDLISQTTCLFGFTANTSAGARIKNFSIKNLDA